MTSDRKKFPMPPTVKASADFRRISKIGKRFRHDFLQLTVAGNSSGRFGITIPEKSVRHSAHRNRVRRMIKEVLRRWWDRIDGGRDLVFYAYRFPEVDHARYVEFIVLELLVRSRVLTEDGTIEAGKRLVELADEFGVKAENK